MVSSSAFFILAVVAATVNGASLPVMKRDSMDSKFTQTRNGVTYCLAPGTQAQDGLAVTVVPCQSDEPKWDFAGLNAVGSVSAYNFRQCLDVKDGNNSNGAKLQTWTCSEGNANQQWQYNPDSGHLQWAGTNKCLDIPDGNPDGFPQLQIWDCYDNGGMSPQTWSLQ